MPTALIVDDHEIIRKGLVDYLKSLGIFTSILEARTAREARMHSQRSQLNFIVMDIVLPDGDGLELIREFRARLPDAGILAITGASDRHVIGPCMKAGANGFADKSMPVETVHEAIDTVALKRKPFFNIDDSGPIFSQSDVILSKREREVCILIACSKTNKEIATELGLSVHTVAIHRRNLMRKLNVHDSAGVTRYAIKDGLIHLN